MPAAPAYTYEFLFRPGRTLPEETWQPLVRELRAVAATCLDPLPEYQCLAGTREELEDKVIVLARRPDGSLVGFSSAVLLRVEGVGDVLHLGLTCVRPDSRGDRLTHKLTSRLVIRYMLFHAPVGRIWVSNVACVLSSLGNVAVSFEQVFPSPGGPAAPCLQARIIAAAYNRRYRHKLAINQNASFDPDTFVFRGSVAGTPFQKHAGDTRFHHRAPAVNHFYTELMAFEHGDEVLQVGYVTPFTSIRYACQRIARRLAPRRFGGEGRLAPAR